jgi:hypothetical protein
MSITPAPEIDPLLLIDKRHKTSEKRRRAIDGDDKRWIQSTILPMLRVKLRRLQDRIHRHPVEVLHGNGVTFLYMPEERGRFDPNRLTLYAQGIYGDGFKNMMAAFRVQARFPELAEILAILNALEDQFSYTVGRLVPFRRDKAERNAS